MMLKNNLIAKKSCGHKFKYIIDHYKTSDSQVEIK